MSWNADSPTFQNPAGTCGSTPRATFDTSVKHQGAASMKVTITDSQGDAGCKDFTPVNDFGAPLTNGQVRYYRWWMKIGSGFKWGNFEYKMKAMRIKQTAQVNPLWATGYIAKTGIQPWGQCDATGCDDAAGDYPQPTLGYDFTDESTTGNDVTHWHEYIVYIKFQTGCNRDAVMKLYVDGVLKSTVTGWRLWNCTTPSSMGDATQAFANGFGTILYSQLCPNGSVCGDGGTIWVDDFSVDDSWNSDVSPQPLPPTQLAAQ